jgi:hypothetical protein
MGQRIVGLLVEWVGSAVPRAEATTRLVPVEFARILRMARTTGVRFRRGRKLHSDSGMLVQSSRPGDR